MLEQITNLLNHYKYVRKSDLDEFNNGIKTIKELEEKKSIISDNIKLYPNKIPRKFRVSVPPSWIFEDLISLHTSNLLPTVDTEIRFNLFGFFPIKFSKNVSNDIHNPNIQDYIMDLKLMDINPNPSTKIIELDFEFCNYNRSEFTFQRILDVINIYSKFTDWASDSFKTTHKKSLSFLELKRFIKRGNRLESLDIYNQEYLSLFEDYKINITDPKGKKYILTYGSKLLRRYNQYKNNSTTTFQVMDKFTTLTNAQLKELCESYIDYQNEDADNISTEVNEQFEKLKTKLKTKK